MSEMTFMKSFQEVENQNAQQMVGRADKALNDDVQSLNTLNHDWAAWDDTYNFVQNPTEYQSYINDNPTDETFASAKLNFICIINNSDQLVFGKGFDLATNTDMPVPESLDQQILGSTLSHHDSVNDSVSGIILLPEGPLLISSEPILTSQGQGPIAGTIIMARLPQHKRNQCTIHHGRFASLCCDGERHEHSHRFSSRAGIFVYPGTNLRSSDKFEDDCGL